MILFFIIQTMDNKKNITFRITGDTFSFCSSFIEDTKFDILHKDDPDLIKFILPVINESMVIRERQSKAFLTGNIFHREKIMLSVVQHSTKFYVYDKKFLNGIYRMISFFSNCYEKHYQSINTSDVSMIKVVNVFTTYDLLYLWLFFSLKDILGIDERIIHISDHNSKTMQSFQNIVEHMYTSLLQLYEAFDIHMKTQPSVNGEYQMLLEIGRRINNNSKNNNNFIVNLRNYDEFDYFINRYNNPKEGALTHLRFL